MALICRLLVEQINVMVSAGGPLVLALRCLRFVSASQILFFFIKNYSFVNETSPL